MRTKLVSHLSVNALQLIINQSFGLLIFYILSIGLDKGSFGQINLVLALLLAVFNILSFGIDQVAVRKIAAGENPQTILSLYLAHVLFTGLLFYIMLLAAGPFFPADLKSNNLLLLIAAGKLAIYFSTPFKQSAIGMERFRLLAKMSVVSNIARGISLTVLTLVHRVTLQTVIITFVAGDVLELLMGLYLFRNETGLPSAIEWSKGAYRALVKESLPQLG